MQFIISLVLNANLLDDFDRDADRESRDVFLRIEGFLWGDLKKFLLAAIIASTSSGKQRSNIGALATDGGSFIGDLAGFDAVSRSTVGLCESYKNNKWYTHNSTELIRILCVCPKSPRRLVKTRSGTYEFVGKLWPLAFAWLHSSIMFQKKSYRQKCRWRINDLGSPLNAWISGQNNTQHRPK